MYAREWENTLISKERNKILVARNKFLQEEIWTASQTYHRNDEWKSRISYHNPKKKHRERERAFIQPAKPFPIWRSTPSTAAAIALPCSAAFSILDMASYKHFVISNKAITSPFSTTGRCLNFPAKHLRYQKVLNSISTTEKS